MVRLNLSVLPYLCNIVSGKWGEFMVNEPIRDKKLLYHLTHIDNLQSIIQNGLLSRNMLNWQQTDFFDVANSDIIRKRGPILGDYIPFHFHQRSYFDYAVNAVYGWENLIYLCITREYARQNNFKIIPTHPLGRIIQKQSMMDYDEGFDAIDWEKMECEYSKMMECEESDRREIQQVRMAECLTDKDIPFKNLFCIFYLTFDQKCKIVSVLQSMRIPYPWPYINDGTGFHRC